MVKITMEGEGDTVVEALHDLSLNVERAIERARDASDDADGEAEP